MSAHEIHDDLVATLGPKTVAYNTVTRHIREVKFGSAEITVDPQSVHLTSTIPTGLSWQPGKKTKAVFVRSGTYPSHLYYTHSRL
jgi:hypothetical protein